MFDKCYNWYASLFCSYYFILEQHKTTQMHGHMIAPLTVSCISVHLSFWLVVIYAVQEKLLIKML